MPDTTAQAGTSRFSLRPFLARRKGLLAFAVLFSILEPLVAAPVPFIVRMLVDTGSAGNTETGASLAQATGFVVRLALLLAALAIFRGFFVTMQRRYGASAAQKIIRDIRRSLFARVALGGVDRVRRRRAPVAILRLTSDAGALSSLLGRGVFQFAADSLLLLVLSVTAIIMDARMAAAAGIVIGAHALIMILAERHLSKAARAVRSTRGRMARFVHGAFTGDSPDRSDKSEFRKLTNKLSERTRTRDSLSGALGGTAQATTGVLRAVVLGTGALLLLNGQSTPGAVIAFFTVAVMASSPVRRISRIYTTFILARISLEKLRDWHDKNSGTAATVDASLTGENRDDEVAL
jgi:ATP-binding cassette subfamily B protein